MATVESKTYTPADLLAMPDSNNIELVDCEFVAKPMSVLSAYVEGKIYLKLGGFCDAQNMAVALPATNGVRCFPDPLKVRKPDVSVFRKERFTRDHLMEGFISIAPDLAVEVVSSHDEFAEITEKVEEYLAAGVLLVWIIDPVNEIVIIHRKDGSVAKLHRNDTLNGEDVLPGFSCTVADLLPSAENLA